MIDVKQAIEVGSYVATPLITLVGLVKAWPWLKRQGDLVAENAAVRKERDAANARADIAAETAEAWKARFESLDGRIDELRTEFKEQLDELKHKLDISVKYICMLSVWAHDPGHASIPMPQPPAELRDDIDAGLREQAAIAQRAATEH